MNDVFFQWAQLGLGSGLLLVAFRVSMTMARYMQRLETLETSFHQFVAQAGPKIDTIQSDMSWLRGRVTSLADAKEHHDHHGV